MYQSGACKHLDLLLATVLTKSCCTQNYCGTYYNSKANVQLLNRASTVLKTLFPSLMLVQLSDQSWEGTALQAANQIRGPAKKSVRLFSTFNVYESSTFYPFVTIVRFHMVLKSTITKNRQISTTPSVTVTDYD